MSNENCNVEVKEESKCDCICHSKWFKKFLIVAFGSFAGVFCALSLFAALHKPPMPIMPPCPCGCAGGYHVMMKHHHNFDKDMKREFYKKMLKESVGEKSPVRVEIAD